MLAGYVLKFVLPLFGCTVGLFVARRRGFSLAEDLGFRLPRLKPGLWWAIGWMTWLAVSEGLISHLGLAQAERWPSMPVAAMAARIGALVVSGPAVEEVVTRGLAMAVLSRRGWPPAAAIVATSVVWAAAHYRYGWETLVMLTVDGVMLGSARLMTGSLWMPFGMHVLGNALSVSQSVGAWAPR